jgi:hypothetical protein
MQIVSSCYSWLKSRASSLSSKAVIEPRQIHNKSGYFRKPKADSQKPTAKSWVQKLGAHPADRRQPPAGSGGGEERAQHGHLKNQRLRNSRIEGVSTHDPAGLFK